MSLNKNTVIKIANLSKIDIRDSEIEEFSTNLHISAVFALVACNFPLTKYKNIVF